MGRKIITALRLLLFDRRSFVQRIFCSYYGRYDIFIFYVQVKIRSYFLSNKKRLFIDLGANIGQAYQFFSGIYPSKHYDYVLVEPNKFCIDRLKLLVDNSNVTILQSAAWIRKEKKLFYGVAESGNSTSLGASIITNHKTKSYNVQKETAVFVETFNFSNFLLEKSMIYDEIIVKMDVESSEYDILEKLINDKNIKLIDKLFVEFHSNWMKKSETKDAYILREKRLIDTLPFYTKLHIWV
jgi:FkbM family methyltransferase